MSAIVRNFDAAALGYDRAARIQEQVAAELVTWAASHMRQVDTILDIGCGTGLVAEAVNKRWPEASLTALDQSPAMLQEAQRKISRLKIVMGDAASLQVPEKYDLIVSSMMLHWLRQPEQILGQWQNSLNPGGKLCVALLGSNSFHEWRDLCHKNGVADGLWPMPSPRFAESIAVSQYQKILAVPYTSAHEFLRRLKNTGAATPHVKYSPLRAGTMRKLLAKAARPFVVTYEVLYLMLESS